MRGRPALKKRENCQAIIEFFERSLSRRREAPTALLADQSLIHLYWTVDQLGSAPLSLPAAPNLQE